MKKVSTLKLMALLCAVPFFVNGQSASRLKIRNSEQPVKLLKIEAGEETPVVNRAAAPTVRNISATAKRNAAATIIGSTTYDLQSNASMPRRIVAYPDGKVSVVWTGSTDPAPSGATWGDRGTFYNTFDGSSWGAAPTTRIDGARTGWGNLNVVTAGEISLAHVDRISSNTGPGTAWTNRAAGEFRALTWPRVATVGNTVHAIISTSAADLDGGGFTAPVYYGKSTDGGASFDTVRANFAAAAGYDSSNHAGDIGGDAYAIDASGNIVAILILGTTEDVVLLKSTDAGATWTRNIIREFPIKKYVDGITDANGDGVADTLLGTTSNGSVVIDGNGVVHVVFADLLVLDAAGTGLSVFLTATSDYFNYWNDADKVIKEVPVLVDSDNDGVFSAGSNFTGGSVIRYGNSGYSLHPMLSVGAAGTAWANNIFLTYVAVAENDTNDVGVDFRSIWSTSTSNNGNNWSNIVNISQTQNVENAFVTVPREVGADGFIHMSWQQDYEPGNAVQAQHPGSPSDIIYDKLNIAVGINNSKKLDADIVAFPNPTSDVANFNINVNNASKAELKLVNILGQTVRTMSADLNAGANKVSMNVADLNAGLYTLVLTSNGKSATEKIMVK